MRARPLAALACALAFAFVAGCSKRASTAADDLYEGEHAFAFHCAKCHAVDREVKGPSLREIARLYPGDADAIARWARQPGRRRANVEPMPDFAMLGDDTLRAIGRYVLRAGGDGAATSASSARP